MSGTLYIVATPIGHLQDFSARALDILHQVDVIACEDTRHSRRLLESYGIDQPLLALHQHNEHSAASGLLNRLKEGGDVALISDAGTPLISDPGQWLTQAALAEGVRVSPIPGASSVMAALSVSGLPADQFVFAGFVPSKKGERERFIADFAASSLTTVMFETPHRIAATLAELAKQLNGQRELVIARELTKQFEQIVRLPLAEAEAWLAEDSNRSRGEFVLLLAGCSGEQVEEAQWQAMADDFHHAGLSDKDNAALVAKYCSVKKKKVYQYLLDIFRQ
ncbi:16S rRNA (cytidine(1402)-2'-O)-methyltransferase [Suttonella sp. R2A3]|uniref:16S rRNA (cytidine(1402)-2'-O)-methyltransferase n=1 Tax=Suttonella sp. R2A3 TaxID=2908648 RepID=UPI001F2C90A8|nr:16S rRNA (cytidine(1402)-2'-O)-methyltransferase [Suttonella sp. R2A3]UJF24686.1 16S rRNA (cytidine(1402)-2'-O)-methyltransferase [Suttonella sp. R2A3]